MNESYLFAGKGGLVLMSFRTRASPTGLLPRRCRAEGGQTVAVRAITAMDQICSCNELMPK